MAKIIRTSFENGVPAGFRGNGRPVYKTGRSSEEHWAYVACAIAPKPEGSSEEHYFDEKTFANFYQGLSATIVHTPAAPHGQLYGCYYTRAFHGNGLKHFNSINTEWELFYAGDTVDGSERSTVTQTTSYVTDFNGFSMGYDFIDPISPRLYIGFGAEKRTAPISHITSCAYTKVEFVVDTVNEIAMIRLNGDTAFGLVVDSSDTAFWSAVNGYTAPRFYIKGLPGKLSTIDDLAINDGSGTSDTGLPLEITGDICPITEDAASV